MRTTSRSTRLVSCALGATILLALVAGVEPVLAHTGLVSTDPADGSTVDRAPRQIAMVFTEAVEPSLATVLLVDTGGLTVAGLEIEQAPNDRSSLLVRLPELPNGAYRLAWRIVDDTDLHVTSGSIVFGIGIGVPASTATQATDPSLVEVLARSIGTVGEAIVAGTLLLLLVAVRESTGRGGSPNETAARIVAALRRRLLVVASVAAAVGLAAAAILLIIEVSVAADGGVPVQTVLNASHTTPSIVALLALIVVLAASIWAARSARRPMAEQPRPRRRVGPTTSTSLALAALAALAVVAVLRAASGHAAAGDDGGKPIRIAMLAAHLGAAWSWFGGLAVVSIGVLPLLRREEAAPVARATLGRFWRIAIPAIAVLAVTGFYLAGWLVATVDAMLLTLYGQALMAKAAIVLGVATLGLLNAASIHDGLARLVRLLFRRPGAIGRTLSNAAVGAEAVGLLAIVVVAAVLASSPPARGPAFDRPAGADASADAREPEVTVGAADLLVRVALRPGRPGPNFLDIAVMDTRRPAPAAIETVAVRLVSPSGLAEPAARAESIGPGRYQLANGAIGAQGQWQIGIDVSRHGLPDASVEVPWAVHPAIAAPIHRVVVSDAPLEPIATALAGLIAAIVLALGMAVAIHRIASRTFARHLRRPDVLGVPTREVLP